jgi:fatty acid desaturase
MQLKREKRLQLAFYVLLAAATWAWPWGVFKGYLLPVLVFGPFVLMTRFIFQHAETDPGNAFHAALYLRTGLFSRLLFYNAIGDGHLAHHFFPSIPLYRAGAAADLFHPILLKHGVRQRSLPGVLRAYFFEGREYRTRWEPEGDKMSSPGARGA